MDLPALAARQLADYDRHCPGTVFGAPPLPLTVEDAYKLQLAVAALRVARGEPVAGYKIGCLSPAVQAQLGLAEPVFGHLFQTEVHRSPATLDAAAFCELAIEGEFAVRIARDLPDSGRLLRDPEGAVAGCFPVIELHNYVFRRAPHTAQELIGNNALHAGVILPASEPLLREAVLHVSINGDKRGSARLEDPMKALCLLAAHLERTGRRLRRGDLVLTGSPLPLYPAADGDHIEVVASPEERAAVTLVLSGPR